MTAPYSSDGFGPLGVRLNAGTSCRGPSRRPRALRRLGPGLPRRPFPFGHCRPIDAPGPYNPVLFAVITDEESQTVACALDKFANYAWDLMSGTAGKLALAISRARRAASCSRVGSNRDTVRLHDAQSKGRGRFHHLASDFHERTVRDAVDFRSRDARAGIGDLQDDSIVLPQQA